MTPYKDLIINFQSRTAYKYAYDKDILKWGTESGWIRNWPALGSLEPYKALLFTTSKRLTKESTHNKNTNGHSKG